MHSTLEAAPRLIIGRRRALPKRCSRMCEMPQELSGGCEREKRGLLSGRPSQEIGSGRATTLLV